jgi:hypothetical protein
MIIGEGDVRDGRVERVEMGCDDIDRVVVSSELGELVVV